jgi:hypothetical protein
MNLLNFIQAGGFPMDTNVLDQMQTAYKLFNAFGALAGDRAIIQGCVQTGSTVGNGVIYLNGELLEFRGALAEANIIIIQEVESKEFENGSNNEVHYTRYATFGVGTVQYPWSSFKRGFQTTEILEALELKEDKTTLVSIDERIAQLEKKNAVFQSGGGMVLWNKPANQIPTGWAEVVDWRGRMPVGFDSTQTEFNGIGKTGGAKSTTLVKANIPALDLTLDM